MNGNSRKSEELHQLIQRGYFAKTRDRISENVLDINQPDPNGLTPLILCAFLYDSSWALSLAQQLIEAGVNLKKSDFSRQNILHYCVLVGNWRLLDLILQSLDFDVNASDQSGNTALLYAVASGNSLTTKSLLQYYKRFRIDINKANNCGINVLMQACICEDEEIVEKILSLGADLQQTDNNKKTAELYKDELYAKSKLMQKVTENRRMSRVVRFDNFELIKKLKEENNSLIKENAEQSSEPEHRKCDVTVTFVREFQSRLKKLKRNKVDWYYKPSGVMKSRTSVTNSESVRKRVRPHTTSSLRGRGTEQGWYSLVGPLYVTLQQQHSASFRPFVGMRANTADLQSDTGSGRNSIAGRRPRRMSRRESVCTKIPEEYRAELTSTKNARIFGDCRKLTAGISRMSIKVSD